MSPEVHVASAWELEFVGFRPWTATILVYIMLLALHLQEVIKPSTYSMLGFSGVTSTLRKSLDAREVVCEQLAYMHVSQAWPTMLNGYPCSITYWRKAEEIISAKEYLAPKYRQKLDKLRPQGK